METVNVTFAGGGEHSLAATVTTTDSVVTVEASGRPAPGDYPLVVEVTVVPGGRAPDMDRHARAADAEAGRRAREDEASLDVEDVLTQAEEANAVDPVG